MTTWQLLGGPSTSAPTTILSAASGWKLSAKLSDPSTLDFSVNGRHDQALDLLELATDVHLLRDTAPVFSGRLMPGKDEMTDVAHRTTFQARDLRALLARRIVPADLAMSAVDVASAYVNLWTYAQADPLSRTPNPASLGVTVVQPPTAGVTVTRTSKKGATILSELQAISGGDNASVFDWDVTPGWTNRTTQFWLGGRGTDKTSTVQLDYTWQVDSAGRLVKRSSPVTRVTREVPADSFANMLVLSGGVKTIQVAVPSTKTAAAVKAVDPTNAATGTTQLNVVRGTRDVRPGGLPRIDDKVGQGVYVPDPVVTYDYVDVQIPTTPVQVADGSTVWNIGIWATAEEDTTLIEQAAVAARATSRLAELELLTPTYTVDLARGFWQGPDHIWLGDRVRLILRSGRVQEDVSLRVTGVDVSFDGNGGEQVSLTVGATSKQLMATLLEQQRAISRVARSVGAIT